MHDALMIECPDCGRSFSLALEVSEGSSDMIIDCEVCCRPMSVCVRVTDGEIEGVEVVES